MRAPTAWQTVALALLALSACSEPEFRVRDDGRTITIFGDSASVEFYASRQSRADTETAMPSAVFCEAHTSEPQVTTCNDGRGYLTGDPLKAQLTDLEFAGFYGRGRGPWEAQHEWITADSSHIVQFGIGGGPIPDSGVWTTARVDSLNLGFEHGLEVESQPGRTTWFLPTVEASRATPHKWICRLTPETISWGHHGVPSRTCICRVCLRQEDQVYRSEFEHLQEKLKRRP